MTVNGDALNGTAGIDEAFLSRLDSSDVLKLHMRRRANVSLLGWLKWAGGSPKEILGMKKLYFPSLLLASFLLSFCFIIVLLNFVSDQAKPVSPVINADKHVSENLLEVIERNVGRMKSSRFTPDNSVGMRGRVVQTIPNLRLSPHPHPLPPAPRSRQGLKVQLNVFIEP